MSLKRHHGDRNHDDTGVKRIVRHKEHRDSPPHMMDQDTRKRSISQRTDFREQNSRTESRQGSSYNKFTKFNSHRSNSEERSPGLSRDRRNHHHTHYISQQQDSPPSLAPPSRHIGKGGSRYESRGGADHGSSLMDQIEYSLHISNLDIKASDDELRKALFKEFHRYGYISVKVLGYGKDRKAFVNYQHYDEAKKARKEMQNLRVFSRLIHVEWSKQTLLKYPDVATGRRSHSGVGGVSHAHSDHRGYLDDFRSESSSRMSINEGGGGSRNSTHNHHDRVSPGFEREDKRDMSYNKASGRLSVSNMEAKQVTPIIDPNATRTLFVGNLELDTTERELRDLFSQFGRIESVDIKLAKSAGTTYAFVKFTTITDAINAKDDMHGRLYGNTKLKIGFGKGAPTGKVWVGNLKSTRDLAEVRHEMDRFGLVRRCDYRDGDNHAYIHFESLDAAQAAVSSLDGFRLRNGRNLKFDLHKPLHMRDGDEFDFYTSRRESGEYTPTSNHRHHGNDRDVSYLTRKSSSDSYYNKDRVVSEMSGVDKRPRKRNRSPTERPIRHISSRQRDDYDETGRSKKRAIEDEEEKGHHQRRYSRHHSRDRLGRHDHEGRRRISGDSTSDKGSIKNENITQSGSIQSSTKLPPDTEASIQAITAEASSTTTRMIESDSALKLNNSTEPVSPQYVGGVSKPGVLVQCDSLSELAKLYPSPWRGNLVLKNTGFPARMYLIGGDPSVAESLLRCKDEQNSLRITQRLRLEQPRLEEVNKRITLAGPGGHCILFALPGPTANQNSPDDGHLSMQLRPLRSLVSYLKQKEAAGIVALSAADFGEVGDNRDPKEVVGVLHAFPPCDFSHSQLSKLIPSLGNEPSKEDHIVVLLVKGNV